MKEDSILVRTWLKRHKGPKRYTPGTRGIVRFVRRLRRAATACQIGGEWYAARTLVKAEGEALAAFRDAGLDAYTPEYRTEAYNRKKRVNIITTHRMFPGYVFVKAHPEQVSLIRGCDGVLDMLPGFPHDPVIIPAKDIAKVREAQDRMEFDDTDEARRKRGDTTKKNLAALRRKLVGKGVRIKSGSFAGFDAKVEAITSLKRIQAIVMIFGSENPVELKREQIDEEPLAA